MYAYHAVPWSPPYDERNTFESIGSVPVDVFQGQPSNSLILCWTSWENLNKSAKTSENKSGPPQVWFLGSNFQTPEGTTFICTNNSTQVYKYSSSGRRCVLSPTDECTLVRKVWINPKTTANDLVKMLEETGTKVAICTVKQVLYRHNLKGCLARKKPLLQNHCTFC
jgi:hypothetical protein